MRSSKLLFIAFTLFFGTSLFGQKHFTRAGNITFSSDAPLEKIEASNQTATSIIDIASGKMEFAVLIKAFQFEKALMQEHFNENYMESDKYPKAIFKGAIDDASTIDFKKDGSYPVKVKGSLTVHGETNEVVAEGIINIKEGKISAKSAFEVAVADYKIKIPSVVKDNIAKTVKINVDMDYELFEKSNKQLTENK
jgi:YceI-like protein